jgi:tagatose-6-phosphate ketose/aldose isomerase
MLRDAKVLNTLRVNPLFGILYFRSSMPRSVFDPPLGAILGGLGALPPGDQDAAGYLHTLREICQQPELWEATANQVSGMLDEWRTLTGLMRGIVLTGSGSSCYVGECIAEAVQAATGTIATAISSGDLLLSGSRALPPVRPLLLVSFARSGNSPESAGLLRQMLEVEPEVVHLVVTCNPAGRLAADWANGHRDPRVQVITLDDRTCDRSLVMTSSFTNLALSGLGLAYLGRAAEYRAAATALAEAGRVLLSAWSDPLARVAAGGYDRMIALGDGCSFGAAREAALKMLEMTDGRVLTMAETSLGFRHGPMCALRRDTLLLLLLSSDPLRRAYQMDLLGEVRRKGLGGSKVVVGCDIPVGALSESDLAIDLKELREVPDDWAAILHAVVGQLLAFFRCRAEGLQPDQPAATGAISRVVPEFPLHGVLAKVIR